jgi:hypothetical protein
MGLFQRVRFYIETSNFTQNAALEGSVIESDYEAWTVTVDCHFYENFGL